MDASSEWPLAQLQRSRLAGPLLSHQFPRYLLIEDFAYGEGDDDGVVVFEEAVYFAQGVFGVVEGDIEPFLATGAAHRRLELVNIGASHAVFLLHLPMTFFNRQISWQAPPGLVLFAERHNKRKSDQKMGRGLPKQAFRKRVLRLATE